MSTSKETIKKNVTSHYEAGDQYPAKAEAHVALPPVYQIRFVEPKAKNVIKLPNGAVRRDY